MFQKNHPRHRCTRNIYYTKYKKVLWKSLFSCPYCDGWEQKDKPLVVMAEKEEHVLHLTKLIYNWSQDLVVLTNGTHLSKEGKMELQNTISK